MATKPRPIEINMSFGCFLYSLMGWLVLEASLLRAAAKAAPLLIAAVAGLGLCAIALRRRQDLWDGVFVRKTSAPEVSGRHLVRNAAELLALIAAGVALGFLAAKSFTLFGMAAVVLAVAPWSQLRACRDHFIASATALGLAAALTMHTQPIDLLCLLVVSWMLWTIALTCLLATLGKSRKFADENGRTDTAVATPAAPSS